MSDIKCPDCGNGQYVNYDNHGYDVKHIVDCEACGKKFSFTRSVPYNYKSFCIGDHDMEDDESTECALRHCKSCDFYE